MKKIIFVCLGNICRSPTAEGVFRKMIKDEGLEQEVEISSAGTAGYHIGSLPDPRSREHASKRGYDLSSRAKQFDPGSDFSENDLILVMDDSNLRNILALDKGRT